MANLVPISALTPVIRLEAYDIALGGASGIVNAQAQALLNNIQYLLDNIANPPTGTPDTASGTEDTTLTGNVLTNDTTPIPGPLSVTSFVFGGVEYTAGVRGYLRLQGYLQINANGSWVFDPYANYNGVVSTITYHVTNGVTTGSGTLVITLAAVNDAPVTGNDIVDGLVNTTINVSVIDNDIDIEGDPLTVTKINGVTATVGSPITVTNATVTLQSNQKLQVIPSSGYVGTVTFTYTVTDGVANTNGSVSVKFLAAPRTIATSNYKTNTLAVGFDFASNIVAKNETVYEPSTGSTMRRMTDVTKDFPGRFHMYTQYSRFSPENASGEYFLAAVDNSTSSVVMHVVSGNVVCKPSYDTTQLPTHTVGAYHECRWHGTMAFPYRLYFMVDTRLMMIDDVRNGTAANVSVVKDFNSIIDWGSPVTSTWGVNFASTRKVYMDQEGNSSLDSNRWAFMAGVLVDGEWKTRAFISYEVSSDTVHTLYPEDTLGMGRIPGGEWLNQFFNYTPNTVEVTPDGSGVVLMNNRSYPGNQDEYISSCFEAPYIWPFDLRQTEFTPFRVAVDSTHSGWCTVDGIWYYVHQDNRRDIFTACPISGFSRLGYGNENQLDITLDLNPNAIDFFVDTNPFPGVHFCVTGAGTDGWVCVSSYATQDSATTYRANDLVMMQVKRITDDPPPIYWHIAPAFNRWPPGIKQDYNENQAAMNFAGTRIYTGGDFSGFLDHVEMLSFQLPANWQDQFAPSAPVNTSIPVVTGTAQQGQTLSTSVGAWTGSPTPTFTYAWLRGATVISGATSPTYLITGSDIGTQLRSRVTGTNSQGSSQALSNQTAVVSAAPVPINTVAPVVTGTAIIGSTLSTTNGSWANSPTSYAYQWLRGASVISGATSSTYTLVTADFGSAISSRVVASNAYGASSPATSAPTSAVTADSGGVTIVTETSADEVFASSVVYSSFDCDVGNLLVVSIAYDTRYSYVTGVSDTAGHTYILAGTVVSAEDGRIACKQYYVLSTVAYTGNVITATAAAGTYLSGSAVQINKATSTWSVQGSTVTAAQDFSNSALSLPSLSGDTSGAFVVSVGQVPTLVGTPATLLYDTVVGDGSWISQGAWTALYRHGDSSTSTYSTAVYTSDTYGRLALVGTSFVTALISGDPVLDSMNSYGVDQGSSTQTLTLTGSFAPGDTIIFWGSPVTTTYVDSSTLTCSISSTLLEDPNYGTVAVRRSSTSQSYPLPYEATPTGLSTVSNFEAVTAAITPSYGTGPGTPPTKGSSVTQTVTGNDVTRITDTADATGDTPTVNNFRTIYSKWSSINATGEYAFVEIEDSFTSYLYRLSDNVCLGKITGTSCSGGSLGEYTEPRWSTRGDEPNIVYYLGNDNTKLYKKDIVAGTSEVLVFDFATELSLTTGEYVMCDSEGTPSIDMRFWAFFRRDDGFLGAREIMVLDLYTGELARCKGTATAGFYTINATGGLTGSDFTSRPNWVSMSPRGDRVQLGYGRVYTGNRDTQYGSDLDMPHTFSSKDWSDPKVCAVDETHGAWAWGPNMEQVWVYQNNRLDTIEACLDVTQSGLFRDSGVPIGSQTFPAANESTNNRKSFQAMSGSWNNSYAQEPGVHFMYQMSGRKRGFLFTGTGGTYNSNAYGYNCIIAYHMSDTRAWKITSLPTQYLTGDYFTECFWNLDSFSVKMIGGLNWMNTDTTKQPDEVYKVILGTNWHTNAYWS